MIIDIVFAIIIVLAIIKGFQKGLIIGLFSFIAIFIGLAAALKLSVYATQKLSGTFNTAGKWLPFISFLLVFLIVLIIVNLGGKLIQKSVEMLMLGWLNRIGGIVLYALLYCIFLSILLFYAVQLKIISVETVAASQAYPFIQPLGPKVMDSLGSIIPIFKDMFAQLEAFFEKVPDVIPKK